MIVRKKVKIDAMRDSNIKKYIEIWKLPGKESVFYTSKMAVDADGSPRAYHPQNRPGLDDIFPNGELGIAMRKINDVNEFYIQGIHDPCPGYYVSQTALNDYYKKDWDPSKYVNSEEIPYVVIPATKTNWGINLGDFGVVINLRSMKGSYIIVADTGPPDKIGEGSIALANAIGIPADPRTGGTHGEVYVFYLLFPDSGAGAGKLRSLAEINMNGEKLFKQWGGVQQVAAILS